MDAVFDAITSDAKTLHAYNGYGHDANVYEHGSLINEFFAHQLMRSGASGNVELAGF